MKWRVVLFSECTGRCYIESEHRWKWQAQRAMRRHRLYRVLTWQLTVESVTPVTSPAEPVR